VIRNRATHGLSSLSQFDILDANPRLQSEFCSLWNELVLQEKEFSLRSIILRSILIVEPWLRSIVESWLRSIVDSRLRSIVDSWLRSVDARFSAIGVLRKIRHLYIALHQGTDSAPTQFSTSTRSGHLILRLSSSYPSCNIATHRTHHPVSTVPPPTRHDDPEDSSPHLSLLESHPVPGGTTSSQKADEPIVIPGHPSLPELPRLAHGSPSSSQIANLAQIAPQATSATLASVHEFFDRAPLDPNPLLSVQASRVSCQSSLPRTHLSANTVRPDKLTLDLSTKQMGETSQTRAATSLTPHLGPLPVTVTPSNVPLPSVSVQLGDFLNTL